MKNTPSGQPARKALSCVTNEHGHTGFCKVDHQQSRTSLIISGSSAEVGSSNSMMLGAHAERTGRCHALLLPRRKPGRETFPLFGNFHRSRYSMAMVSASAFGGLGATRSARSVQFSSTMEMGKTG